jgi:hypothetical protein
VTRLRERAGGWALFFTLLSATESAAQPKMPSASDPGYEIVEAITKTVRRFEALYPGSYTHRVVNTRALDPDDGTLRSTKRAVVDVWQYRGEHPLREVRSCQLDGAQAPIKECEEEPRDEPMHEVFTDDAHEHYRVAYGGLADWDGLSSHRLLVIPLKETARHIKGELFFLRDSLRLVGSKATIAKYPFGLKSFAIEMRFADQNGAPVLASGKSDMHIKVPLLFDARIITEFIASDQRLLTRREPTSASPVSKSDVTTRATH